MRYIPCTSNLDGFGWASSILLHHTENWMKERQKPFKCGCNPWFRCRFHCLCLPLWRSQFKQLLTRGHLQTWQVWVAQLSCLMDRQLQPGFSFASHWRKHRRSGPGLVTTCRSTSQHGNCLHSLHCPIASRLHCLGPAVPSCATKPVQRCGTCGLSQRLHNDCSTGRSVDTILHLYAAISNVSAHHSYPWHLNVLADH